MKLHENQDEFKQLVQLTSQKMGIREVFIEKDYWVTYVLKNLASSRYKDKVVFKGGTSLSKVHRTIKRFSEDVDLAYVDSDKKRCQTVFSKIDKSIMLAPLKYMKGHLGEKKGPAKFRKTYHQYPKTIEQDNYGHATDLIILEINSYTNPKALELRRINSYIAEFLKDSGQEEDVQNYELHSFNMNVLNKEKTLVEKLCGLAKYTNREDEKDFDFLKDKIRHLYDVSKLLDDPEVRFFLAGENFEKEVKISRDEDRVNFKGEIWTERKFSDAKIYTETDRVLEKIESHYINSFSDLLYDSEKLPDLNYVSRQIKEVGSRLLSIDT